LYPNAVQLRTVRNAGHHADRLHHEKRPLLPVLNQSAQGHVGTRPRPQFTTSSIELRWRDIDLGAGTLRVSRPLYRGRVASPTSRYGRRQLRLSPGLARSLWSLRKESRGSDAALVFTTEGGQRIDQSNLTSRVLKPAAADAGIAEWVGDGRSRRAESWVGLEHRCGGGGR